jgi:hypothetical protein
LESERYRETGVKILEFKRVAGKILETNGLQAGESISIYELYISYLVYLTVKSRECGEKAGGCAEMGKDLGVIAVRPVI